MIVIINMKTNIIHQMDCIEGLRKLPDNSIDLIVTDPPYMISQSGKRIKIKGRINIALDFGEWDHFANEDKFFEFTEAWFRECCRVLKPKGWIYIFFSYKKLGFFDLFLAKKHGIKYKTTFAWLKTNPYPAFRANWLSASEFVWIGCKHSGPIKNYLGHKEMYNYMLTPNKAVYGETTHPTEKPKTVIERFIKASSSVGDIVLDPFMGSGTTAVVCKSLNRKYIGFKSNSEYHKLALARLCHTTPPKSLSKINGQSHNG